MKTNSVSGKKTPPRCRAPNGVDSIGRISLALMPDERDELCRRAAMDGRTVSAMARVYMIRGMQDDTRFSDLASSDLS